MYKQERFIQKALLVHGGTYDYSLVNYVSSDVTIIIICSIHGQFSQSPNSHINSQTGCPKCGYETKRKQTNLERYGAKNPAQNKEVQEKTKQTNLERYGAKNPAQNKEVQKKQKQTNLERYGHENIAHGTKKEKVTQTNLERYHGHPRKTKEVQGKQKQTNLERYGVEHPIQNKKVQEKQKQTNLERYGVEHPIQNKEVQEKQKQTNLEKYGVEYVYQNKEVQEKQKQTNLERYGCLNPFGSLAIREKIKQTNLDKYGTNYHSQKHMVDVLPLIQDYSWLFDQYIIQNKTAIQIAKELGIGDTTVGTYLRRHEIEIKQHFWISYKSQLWLNQQEGIIIPEYKIPGTRLRADGYCAATNTIYEFHGDYWHGNPEIYSPEVINEVNGLTMGELYQQTIERENLIKSLGYNLAVMWENNFDNQ